jgi:putative NADPH-quinone reductase
VHAVIVWAHPSPDSYSAALCRSAERALAGQGHTVEVLDLYADRFAPVMGSEEWRAYRHLEAALDDQTGRYAAAVQRAEILVFVYPTWWFGLPAILKGWLERVMVPGVAFDLDPVSRRVRGQLGHIRHLVAITTHGSSWRHVKAHGDTGRRTLMWTLRLVCSRQCRSTWLALYDLDRAGPGRRAAFLADVAAALGQPAPTWTTMHPLRRLPRPASTRTRRRVTLGGVVPRCGTERLLVDTWKPRLGERTPLRAALLTGLLSRPAGRRPRSSGGAQ